MGGIGGNIKSDAGSILHVFSGKIEVTGSLEAECEAILYVANLCLLNKVSAKRIVICSDSSNAIEAVRTGLRMYMPLKGIPKDLYKLLGHQIFLNYVPRELNEEANVLAKAGVNRSPFYSYWACKPNFSF